MRTAKEELKLSEFVLQVKNNKNDICLFQETRINGDGEIEYDDPLLKGWQVLYSGFKKKSQAGVAIVLAPHVKVEDVLYIKSGRIIGARVVVRGT